MKVVVLTNDSWYGRKILLRLKREGIAASAVIVHQSVPYNFRLFRGVAKRIGLFDTIRQAIHRFCVGYGRNRTARNVEPEMFGALEELAEDVIVVRSTNGPETVEALRRLDCDLLVLGHSGIVRKNVLAIPKIGTLNGHGGILPFYRGIDNARWAILQGDWDKVGVTVHWVDEGVDTGAIIATRPYKIATPVNSDQLETILFEECVDLLADVVRRLINGETLNGTRAERGQGRQYYKMHSSLIRTVDGMLAGSKPPN